MEEQELELELDFDTWFDVFVEKTIELGYGGPIDKYSFEWYWEDGETPEDRAKEFVDEMNS